MKCSNPECESGSVGKEIRYQTSAGPITETVWFKCKSCGGTGNAPEVPGQIPLFG